MGNELQAQQAEKAIKSGNDTSTVAQGAAEALFNDSNKTASASAGKDGSAAGAKLAQGAAEGISQAISQLSKEDLITLAKKGAESGIGNIGDKIGISDLIDRKRDSVRELSTGDTLVRVNGSEYLFMPNGDKLQIDPNGNYKLQTKGPVDVSKKGDVTTIKYPNGDSVAFDSEGVLSVQRDGKGESFGRRPHFEHPGKPPWDGGDVRPMPMPYPPDHRPRWKDQENQLPRHSQDGTSSSDDKSSLPNVIIEKKK